MDFVGVIVGLFDVRTVLIASVIFVPLERCGHCPEGNTRFAGGGAPT